MLSKSLVLLAIASLSLVHGIPTQNVNYVENAANIHERGLLEARATNRNCQTVPDDKGARCPDGQTAVNRLGRTSGKFEGCSTHPFFRSLPKVVMKPVDFDYCCTKHDRCLRDCKAPTLRCCNDELKSCLAEGCKAYTAIDPFHDPLDSADWMFAPQKKKECDTEIKFFWTAATSEKKFLDLSAKDCECKDARLGQPKADGEKPLPDTKEADPRKDEYENWPWRDKTNAGEGRMAPEPELEPLATGVPEIAGLAVPEAVPVTELATAPEVPSGR